MFRSRVSIALKHKKFRRRKKVGRPHPASDRDTTRMRDSLPVTCHAGSARLHGQSWHGAAAFQRQHGQIVTAAQAIASNGPPVPCSFHAAHHLSLAALTAAGHAEPLAAHPSRAAVAMLAHLDAARSQYLISRVG